MGDLSEAGARGYVARWMKFSKASNNLKGSSGEVDAMVREYTDKFSRLQREASMIRTSRAIGPESKRVYLNQLKGAAIKIMDGLDKKGLTDYRTSWRNDSLKELYEGVLSEANRGYDILEEESLEGTRNKIKRRNIFRGLEKASLISSVIGLCAGILFLSFNLTGNTIADLSNKSLSLIGVGLFLLGLIAGLFWFKIRKK